MQVLLAAVRETRRPEPRRPAALADLRRRRRHAHRHAPRARARADRRAAARAARLRRLNPPPATHRTMISGKTTLIAHLGYPTEAFKAPMIYNPWFEQHGIDAVVVPIGVKAEDYPATLAALATADQPARRPGDHAAQGDDARPRRRGDADGAHRRRLQRAAEARRRHAGSATSSTAPASCAASSARAGASPARSVLRRRLRRRRLGDRRLARRRRRGRDRRSSTPTARRPRPCAGRLLEHYPELAVRTGSQDPAGHDIVVNATPLGMKEDDALPFDIDRVDAGDAGRRGRDEGRAHAAAARGAGARPARSRSARTCCSR